MKKLILLFALPFAFLAGCGAEAQRELGPMPQDLKEMLVAGGCFWCVEADFEKVDGVYEVVSGYGGGSVANPTYRNYSDNGHREVALIRYNPEIVTFEELATLFIRTIDVTDAGGQFCDRGFGYTTAVYYGTLEEQEILERVIVEGEDEIGQDIVTPIEPLPTFYAAEDYHQDYYKKNPGRYQVYRGLCGRDRTVRSIWGSAPGDA
ncbi:MAG: peptide-methionine (S)-S-oxide reductase MsrA [Pseudomonadota bacterium]